MTSPTETMWAVYGNVYRYLHDPRLTKPADLGTVIPFLLLGIFSFILSAIVVPSSRTVAKDAHAVAAPAPTSERDGPAEVEPAAQRGEEEKAEGLAALSSVTQSQVARPAKLPPSWRVSVTIIGLFAGWAWWVFALILCVDYEVKMIFGTIVMVAFGVLMTMAIDSELRLEAYDFTPRGGKA